MPCWKLPSWHTLCCVYSDSDCGSQSRLDDSQHMHDVVMPLQRCTSDVELQHRGNIATVSLCGSPCSKCECLQTSSSCLCATLCNTDSTQQMSAHGLLTNKAWEQGKPKVEGDHFSCLTHKHQAASCGLQTCPCCTHTSTPLSPASSISLHRSADVPMGRSAYLLQEQDQECGATVFSQPDRPLESINESRLQVV